MPSGTKVKAVELLRAETSVTFQLEADVLLFTIPRVEDYEVGAVTIG
jgi:hypothetical protein